jgi:predicted GH43/DUF377 family glycosyl hydrolase
MAHFNDHVVLTSKFDHEISYVGWWLSPIETDQGWLIIYHGVRKVWMDIYSACAALLDLEDPRKKSLAYPYPLFKPN